jgi:predicted DNA-binding transcriptional regulator YafY
MKAMSRAARLLSLSRLLEAKGPHLAETLAGQLGVSIRTLYRDMGTLQSNGVPVKGTPGTGYHLENGIALPPLTLTDSELGALHLGLALVGQSQDAELGASAKALADKIDAALPVTGAADSGSFGLQHPHAARTLGHIPPLRASIKARQKVELALPDQIKARPLELRYTAGHWGLTIWNETQNTFQHIALGQIEKITLLPELFVDDPGKTLKDAAASSW